MRSRVAFGVVFIQHFRLNLVCKLKQLEAKDRNKYYLFYVFLTKTKNLYNVTVENFCLFSYANLFK